MIMPNDMNCFELSSREFNPPNEGGRNLKKELQHEAGVVKFYVYVIIYTTTDNPFSFLHTLYNQPRFSAH